MSRSAHKHWTNLVFLITKVGSSDKDFSPILNITYESEIIHTVIKIRKFGGNLPVDKIFCFANLSQSRNSIVGNQMNLVWHSSIPDCFTTDVSLN